MATPRLTESSRRCAAALASDAATSLSPARAFQTGATHVAPIANPTHSRCAATAGSTAKYPPSTRSLTSPDYSDYAVDSPFAVAVGAGQLHLLRALAADIEIDERGQFLLIGGVGKVGVPVSVAGLPFSVPNASDGVAGLCEGGADHLHFWIDDPGVQAVDVGVMP
jgi:hypothetical protein